MTYRPSSCSNLRHNTTISMDPSAKNLIDFAKGRQETLDLTIPLKETTTTTLSDYGDGDDVDEKQRHRQQPRRSFHNSNSQEDEPFGSLSMVEEEIRYTSRRRGSMGHGSRHSNHSTIEHTKRGPSVVEEDMPRSRRRGSMGHTTSSSRGSSSIVKKQFSERHLRTGEMSPKRQRDHDSGGSSGRAHRRRSSTEQLSSESSKNHDRSKSGSGGGGGGTRSPPKRGKSLEASLSIGRRAKRSESSRNLIGGGVRTTERSQSSRNLGSGSGRPERSQSSRNLSSGRPERSQSSMNFSSGRPQRSQSTRNFGLIGGSSSSSSKLVVRSHSARDLDVFRTTTGRSGSARNLSISKSGEESSGSGGDKKDKSRSSSRRSKGHSNVSSGSASSSSKSRSRPMRKSKSARSFSLSEDLSEAKFDVSSKTFTRSSSKLSPKPSRRHLRQGKQSSSRDLTDTTKPTSSRSVYSQKLSSNSGSRRHLSSKASATIESRSPTTPGASPKLTTAGLRQEIKESLKIFPDLQNRNKSLRPLLMSSRSLIADNGVKQELKAAASEQQATSTTSSLSSQNDVSSHHNQRRKSPKSDGSKQDSSSTRRSTPQNSKRDLGSDSDSMPALIDDSLQREDLEGKKGDKSWHILEDTPGGHAPEKLNIVEGVEYYPDSMDEDEEILDEFDEDVEEDDTIHQDSVSLPRLNRKQFLPRDPVQKGQKAVTAHSARPADRFNATFQNRDMWKSSDDFNSSGELTTNSFRTREDLDTASELDTTITDNTLTNHTFETYMLEQDCSHQQDKDTPSTLKRAGGRRAGQNKNSSFPELHAEAMQENEGEEEEDDVYTDSNRLPSPVPEDYVMESYEADASGLRRKVKSKSTGVEQYSGSNSTGRSSRRKSLRSQKNQRRSGKRPAKGMGVPTSVPASPYESSYSHRSPLSSSFTSPQTSLSMASSSRQNPQFVSLRRLNEHARNRTLQNYVGRGQSSPRTDDDNNTLGASTITTNFSATQRTLGDNTVSTRSLFRSDVMKGSDMMKIPQRHNFDSDVEDDDDGAGNMASAPPLDAVNSAFDLLQSNDAIAQIAAVLSSEQNFAKISPDKVLRRPSKESDDFFDELEEMRVSSDHSELDLDSNIRSTSMSREFSTTSSQSNDEDSKQKSSSGSDRFSLSSAFNLSPRAGAGVIPKKKKSKRSLFRRVQSWKDRISSEDHEQDLLE